MTMTATVPAIQAGWLAALVRWAGPAVSLGLATALMWHFHDRFWWPPDDGMYGYVAERLLEGGVLHRDIQDVHPGTVHVLHALAMRLFGTDLLSLRYPLAALTIVQAWIVFRLLAPLGTLGAVAGSAAMSCLTFIQFLNPSANWYALFLGTATIALLTHGRPGGRRDLLTGFLLGLVFLFRQPTGVFLGAGTLVLLMTADPRFAGGSAGWPGRILLAAPLAVLTLYLARYANPAGLVLFGIWPLALIAVSLPLAGGTLPALAGLLARLLAGALLAAAPLLAYHGVHGSLGIWLADISGAAQGLVALDFFDRTSHVVPVILAGRAAADPASAVALGFWIALLAAPVALGARVVWLQARRRLPAELAPLLILAAFHGLVSVHYEIPIYLFYSAGLSLAALIAAAPASFRPAAAIGVLAVSAIALVQQAGQPLSRGIDGTARGERIALEASGLPRASIAMETADRDAYRELVALIGAESGPQDTILAVPMNPELYFLADRRAPFRFYTTAFGLGSRADLDAALAVLAGPDRPRLVFHRPDDKYNTALSDELMRAVERTYAYRGERYGFRIYAAPPDAAPAARPQEGSP
jgi:hypothetical protein